MWLSGFFHGQSILSKMGFTLKAQVLPFEWTIIFFWRGNLQLKMEATIKIVILLFCSFTYPPYRTVNSPHQRVLNFAKPNWSEFIKYIVLYKKCGSLTGPLNSILATSNRCYDDIKWLCYIGPCLWLKELTTSGIHNQAVTCNGQASAQFTEQLDVKRCSDLTSVYSPGCITVLTVNITYNVVIINENIKRVIHVAYTSNYLWVARYWKMMRHYKLRQSYHFQKFLVSEYFVDPPCLRK